MPQFGGVDPVAQSVEHNTFNVGVPGSSPGGITFLNDSRSILLRLFALYRVYVCKHPQPFPNQTPAMQGCRSL